MSYNAMDNKVNPGYRTGIHIDKKAPLPLGAYSHAVRAGNLLFLSGQGARDPDTGREVGVALDDSGNVISYDIEMQTHAVIKNMQIVLQAAGCRLVDLVDVSVFLADMNDFPKFNRIYTEYFSFPEPPARTTVAAARLPGKNFIEIKAIAVCPGGEGKL